MNDRTANIAVLGGGIAFGILLSAAATGALAPVWSFFADGLVQHFMSMQWARYSCF
ncbi:MAG: hypothetical protein QF521_17795 [Alphaproteobacteria bacterium]|nr:hypothetical protein [Alphaproteobacteria bacterium]MDP6875379.1 hypothetical protein [Alphaproteobacteria bacterium]